MASSYRNPRNSPHMVIPAGRLMLAAMLGIMLAACSRPAQKTEEIRPVRVMQLTFDNAEIRSEYPGEVRPRIESRLGFRVGGKIVARKVDIGTPIRRGQVLMQLDPQDLQLAQAQAGAGLRAAESNRTLAGAELQRYQELREKNFVSQAVLDAKRTAYQAAQASHEQAVAAWRNQSNQLGYAALVADSEGVVTGIDAEVGQVVAAGTPVVRIAQRGEKEVVIGIPEDQVDAVRRMTDVQVRIWARPDSAIAGKLRELSPAADPVTRTYTARIAMPDAPPEVKLGMTATVTFTARSGAPVLKVPLSALFQDKGTSSVWVVDKGMVRLTPVHVARAAGNHLILDGGVQAGQTIVTAGVNLLKPGQKVRILDADPARNEAAAAGANPAVAASAGAAQ